VNTPARALRQRLAEVDGRPVLFDLYERSRSGSELAENVDRLSGAVLEASREKPRVGLWYRNSLSAVEAFLAVEWIGGTRVPVDPGASAEEARAVFEAAAVDIVLTDASHGAAFGGNALIHDDQHRLAG
jgi:acyl-CoA synthetase (AMP-forming)/AMP-acid ligase II